MSSVSGKHKTGKATILLAYLNYKFVGQIPYLKKRSGIFQINSLKLSG